MKVFSLVISLIISITSVINAQEIDTINILTKDTIRLNPAFDMIVVYDKPPIYDTWFKKLMDCEGLKIPPQEEINKLRFLVVNSESFTMPNKEDMNFSPYDAVTLASRHLIIIRLPSIWDYDVVGHEFLHFVLWYYFGKKYLDYPFMHPPEYFGKCDIRPN